jgi:long-chain acyl-CoA synthetase
MLAGELLCGEAHPARVAIEFEAESWSYSALDALANRFARYFAERGLARGDRVSMIVGNDPLLVGAYFGAFRAGLIANPVNTRLSASELAYVLNHAGSRCVLVGGDLCEAFAAALPMLHSSPHVVVLRPPGAVPFEARTSDDVMRGKGDSPDGPAGCSAEDGALLIYTSGTTGHPKGVLLTHRNVVAAVHIVHRAFEIQPGERTLCVMPLFHTNALMFSHLPFLHGGGTVCLQPRFSASRFWTQCREHGVASSSASPTILAMLLAHQATAPPPGETGLRYLKVASAPTPVDLAERFEARFGSGLLLETYGLTETTAITTMNPLRGPRRFGSIGQVIAPQVLAILGEDGTPLEHGRVGEIGLQGPTIMREYFHDPDNTRNAFAGPWFRSGDMGVQDESGFVTIVGRRKEMILRGGENISPLEIENVAMLHPKVREAVAVGIADALWGEVVGLCVVAREPLGREELVDFCRARLGEFKLPQHVVFVDELPRNAMGKVMRNAARSRFPAAPSNRRPSA